MIVKHFTSATFFFIGNIEETHKLHPVPFQLAAPYNSEPYLYTLCLSSATMFLWKKKNIYIYRYIYSRDRSRSWNNEQAYSRLCWRGRVGTCWKAKKKTHKYNTASISTLSKLNVSSCPYIISKNKVLKLRVWIFSNFPNAAWLANGSWFRLKLTAFCFLLLHNKLLSMKPQVRLIFSRPWPDSWQVLFLATVEWGRWCKFDRNHVGHYILCSCVSVL